MRIFIREKGRLPIVILLPNALVFNSLTARLASRYAPQSVGNLPEKELAHFMMLLRKSAGLLAGRPLVQLEDHEGTDVTLWL